MIESRKEYTMSRVICLGILVADMIAKPVNTLPEKGKLTLVDTIEMHTGGCATNTAISLAKLGEDVGVIGLVGNDGMGDFVESALRKHHVDIRGMKRTDLASTSTSIVLSNADGERSFVHSLGANGIFSANHVSWDVIRDAEILFIAGSLLLPSFDGTPTAEVLKRAKKMGKYTILDTAWDDTGRWMKSIDPCLPYLDLFIPSIEEAAMISGVDDEKQMAEIFMEKGVENVVIKLGSKGCYIKNQQAEYYIPSYSVEAIDTNGAGDSFVAGFITGLLNQWSIEKTGRFANAVGAHCVMEIGASSGIKDKKEILGFMERENIR